VPIVDAVTPVVAVVAEEKVKELGPRTLDHKMFRIPVGRPSSVTVPFNVMAVPLGTVCGSPGSTAGAWFTPDGVFVGVAVGVAVGVLVGVAVGVGVGSSPTTTVVVAVPVRPAGSLTVSVME
jgi:hypothetical protein